MTTAGEPKFTARKWLITFDYKIYRTKFVQRTPISLQEKREVKREGKKGVDILIDDFFKLIQFLAIILTTRAHVQSVKNPNGQMVKWSNPNVRNPNDAFTIGPFHSP